MSTPIVIKHADQITLTKASMTAIVAYLESHAIEIKYNTSTDACTITDTDCDIEIASWEVTPCGIAWFDINGIVTFVGIAVQSSKTCTKPDMPQLILYMPHFEEGSMDPTGNGPSYNFPVDNAKHVYIEINDDLDEDDTDD